MVRRAGRAGRGAGSRRALTPAVWVRSYVFLMLTGTAILIASRTTLSRSGT